MTLTEKQATVLRRLSLSIDGKLFEAYACTRGVALRLEKKGLLDRLRTGKGLILLEITPDGRDVLRGITLEE